MTGILNKCPDRFVETEIDDEIVVMDLESGNFFSLKDTALDIWRLVDGTRSSADIAAELANDYDVAESELADDVAAFLDEALTAGLLEAR
ncbi:PqqD family protein [Novosphingobium arvoryzae]|uniref:PqqD family protein n=1 Tax=Novosphingobium arvoryzae TaxID=1256514 RepID=UPI0035B007A1